MRAAVGPLGLVARSILASVLVAAVAVVATALLTMNATQETLERELVEAADVDQEVVDRLEQAGRTSASWADTRDTVERIADESKRSITITDLDGEALLTPDSALDMMASGAAIRKPVAVLEPLAAIVDRVSRRPPTSPTTLALPRMLLQGRADADDLRIDTQRYPRQVLCAANAPDDGGLPLGMHHPATFALRCDDLVTDGWPDASPLARLANEVAFDEYECLARRGAPAAMVRFAPPPAIHLTPLLTVHLPANWAPADPAQRALVDRAWADCATAALQRRVAPVVAPNALLYMTEIRTTERTLLHRIGGHRILLALGAVLVVVVGASLLAARQVIRPVHGLTEATQRMAAGELSTRVAVTGRDEIARLGRSFNEMAESLSQADSQRRRMVSDVAHELRTPLGNIRAYLEAGQDGVLARDDEWNASLVEEAVVLQHVVDDLQVLALADAGQLVVHPDANDLVATVEAALRALTGYAAAAGVRLELEGDERAIAPHDGLRMRQVLSNLVSNAIRHSPAGATVTVRVTATSPTSPGAVQVAVRDRGDGVADEHLPHLFERFYRADPSRARATGGSGLGLAIVEQLVGAHRGRVEAAHAEGGGLVVTVTLPQS